MKKADKEQRREQQRQEGIRNRVAEPKNPEFSNS
jgi:hypothetical protein